MSIEANIHIECDDSSKLQSVINSIKNALTSFNSLDTNINVVEIDNPLSLSPSRFNKHKADSDE